MYPDVVGLVYGAVMMTAHSTDNRSRNKLYGWLRRKHSLNMSVEQKGKKNSQYGTCWVSNIGLKESKRIHKEELETYLSMGWIKRKIQNWDLIYIKCRQCSKEIINLKGKSGTICSDDCKKERKKERN